MKEHMVKVKICGITNVEDAMVAARAGADLLGFVCYPRSPRYIDPMVAGRIIATLRATKMSPLTVGVFVNASPEEVRGALQVARFDLVQLHGEEPPEMLVALGGRAYKALRPHTTDDLAAVIPYLEVAPTQEHAPQLLVDAYHPAVYGGTGQRGDWILAREIATRVPRLLLAGGLTPDNVVEAVAFVRPWGVDVSSGVERAAGKKDHAKVRAFVARCKRIRIRNENAEVNP